MQFSSFSLLLHCGSGNKLMSLRVGGLTSHWWFASTQDLCLLTSPFFIWVKACWCWIWVHFRSWTSPLGSTVDILFVAFETVNLGGRFSGGSCRCGHGKRTMLVLISLCRFSSRSCERVSESWALLSCESSVILLWSRLTQTQMSNLVLLIEEVLKAVQILDLRPKHLRVKINYNVWQMFSDRDNQCVWESIKKKHADGDYRSIITILTW